MALESYFEPVEGGDIAFTVEAPKLKFGVGSLREVGEDAKALGMTRIALYTDERVAKLEAVEQAVKAVRAAGLSVELFDQVEVEPTDRSFKAGAAFAKEGKFDGFISVGGGSAMDTAKASNLYATYPAEFLTYVNAPVGEARPVPGPLRPHIACPTTFGTASETTGIAIFDMLEMGAKTGIAHRLLRPSLGVLDPSTLMTLPKPVVAANGFDVFSHAIESLTARPFSHRAAPATPDKRPLLQGSNPYSDLACVEAIRLVGENIERAIKLPDDLSAREPLMFAGMLAGIGFGNAGCHVPHAMAYAVAGLVRDYRPEGWPNDHAMVPHGISVILNAPAVFRSVASACPDRHLRAAAAFGADVRNVPEERAGELLADRVIELMRRSEVPNGLQGVGYTDDDIEALTDRTVPQARLLVNSPCPVGRDELRDLFKAAMRYW
ncbi:MAG: iron-containing alcohol dehydrogenase [Alphaproteobacteria bacterium]|nr:iron-containing alcohol dehydrogenase [Alphaproteobacteria bacterium]